MVLKPWPTSYTIKLITKNQAVWESGNLCRYLWHLLEVEMHFNLEDRIGKEIWEVILDKNPQAV